MKCTCLNCGRYLDISDQICEADSKLLGIEKVDYKYVALCERCKTRVQLTWNYICHQADLPEMFIEKYKDIVPWKCISWNQELSEALIAKYKDRVDWYGICTTQTLSESFIAEFKDYVNWRQISYHQDLSEAFIEQFADKLDWVGISSSQKLSKSLIEKFRDRLDWVGYRPGSSNFSEDISDCNQSHSNHKRPRAMKIMVVT
jgi:transcription elongation factor Elf1